MRVVLLTGPPGVGKTTVLAALMNRLEADDVRFAALEVEALALVHPWPDDAAAFTNLRLVSESFAQRGYPFLLVCATITDTEYLARLLASLPSEDVLAVRLEAPPEVLRERVTRREPPDWVGLPRLLAATVTLSDAIAALPGFDLVFSTSDTEPKAVAATVRDAMHTN